MNVCILRIVRRATVRGEVGEELRVGGKEPGVEVDRKLEDFDSGVMKRVKHEWVVSSSAEAHER